MSRKTSATKEQGQTGKWQSIPFSQLLTEPVRNGIYKQKEYQLSARQQKVLAFIMDNGSLTIQDFEKLCPRTTRRTLQRELKGMVDGGLLKQEGATNRRVYRLNKEP